MRLDLYNAYFTPKLVTLYLFVSWFFSLVVFAPNTFGWGKYGFSHELRLCTFDTALHTYAAFYSLCIVAAMLVAVGYYWAIYRAIKRSRLSKRMIVRRGAKVAPATAAAGYGLTAQAAASTLNPQSTMAARGQVGTTRVLGGFFLGGGTSCLYLHAIRSRPTDRGYIPVTLKFWPGGDQPPQSPHAYVW